MVFEVEDEQEVKGEVKVDRRCKWRWWW